MKKILIIGAGGSLAKYVITAIKDLENIELTLFLRNKNSLSKQESEDCTIIEGDAMNYNDLKTAIAGQDIVYVNLAGNLEAMTKNIVKAMQENEVKRIVAISSIGIYETPLKPVLVPYRKLADVIEASGLDYTILRPDWFTNGNEIDYAITHKGNPETGSAISRKSIAAFISTIIKNTDLYKNENLGISRLN
ncbi:NAD(P)H-binding protein [Flavobacterium aquicola]|uniref:Putative NAD(P)-binding protein n=1 Tax=Flavobacterium aquicola TaxID=1682742 RepID=A0A3E0EIM2_9FLAO|nr:NAD(P)H-binding protein [Flavobacterium aquicola]REG98005.1 putative NAD(P)-binding protein [Flavobacterium aquicola]